MNTVDVLKEPLSAFRDKAQLGRTTTQVRTLRMCKQAMTYQIAAVLAGYGWDHQRDVNFHRHLGETMKEDVKDGSPLACSLIVNKQWRMPGEQYFAMARSLGFKIAMVPAAERAFWESQLRLMTIDPATLVILGG